MPGIESKEYKLLDLGMNLNNQMLPDLGKPMDIGFPKDQGKANDGLRDESFQNLLEEKMQPAADVKNYKTDSKRLDAVEIEEDDSFEKLEKPILFAPELPKMLEAFPVAAENVGPMRQFLTRIDKEAGVKPEVWAEAMLKLKPEDQLKSPWETAKAVVAQLEIPGDKKATVVKAYDKLLADMNVAGDIAEKNDEQVTTETLIALAPMMAAASALREAPVKEAVVKPEVIKKAKLDDVELINTKGHGVDKKVMAFGKVTEQKPISEIVDSSKSGIEVSGLTKMDKPIDKNAMPKFSLDDIKAGLADPKPMDFKNVGTPTPEKLIPTAQIAEQLPVETINLEDVAPLAAEEAVIPKFLLEDKNLSEDEALSSISSGELKDAKVQNYKKIDLGDFKADTKSGGKKSALADHKAESESKATKSSTIEMPKFFIDNNSQVASRELSVRAEGIGAGMIAGAAAINREDANTAEIIRQAQFMVRNGGGEVRIKLNPENLGEISMKMSVEGDKVQLTLDTSTQEAKKLIEGSLSELRATLSANKLSLENVKVDVAGKSDNQFSNQRNETDGGAAREQARQFMNNFREDNQSRRSAMARDMNEVRSRPSTRASVAATGRNSYSRGASASGRLNLVA